MRTLFTSPQFKLAPGQLCSGVADYAGTLRVETGSVWLTVEGDLQDYVLMADDENRDLLPIAPGRLVVVEALSAGASITISEGVLNYSARSFSRVTFRHTDAARRRTLKETDMETLLPLALYAFVSSITPGPNNIMLTTSGILFGFVRSIPHMLGITVGFGMLLAVCATGIGALILAVPAIHLTLKILGSGYLLYLAWQLRRMAFKHDNQTSARPMTFLAAAIFQFVNPKAWVMAITGASAFLPVVQPVWFAIALFCLVFCAINLPCIGMWAGTGAVLRRYLAQPRWQRLFCGVMITLTVYSAIAIWL